jgi:hypothetical protein
MLGVQKKRFLLLLKGAFTCANSGAQGMKT